MFNDSTNPDGTRGHRTQMLNPENKEIGSGIGTGNYTYDGVTYQAFLSVQDMGVTGTNTFLTGVAYTDQVIQDNFYEPGEGMGNVTVTAVRNSDEPDVQRADAQRRRIFVGAAGGNIHRHGNRRWARRRGHLQQCHHRRSKCGVRFHTSDGRESASRAPGACLSCAASAACA